VFASSSNGSISVAFGTEVPITSGAINKRTASRDKVRSHFQYIAKMFAAGSFEAPMLAHGKNVPGTATIAGLKSQLHWDLRATPRGAKDQYHCRQQRSARLQSTTF